LTPPPSPSLNPNIVFRFVASPPTKPQNKPRTNTSDAAAIRQLWHTAAAAQPALLSPDSQIRSITVFLRNVASTATLESLPIFLAALGQHRGSHSPHARAPAGSLGTAPAYSVASTQPPSAASPRYLQIQRRVTATVGNDSKQYYSGTALVVR